MFWIPLCVVVLVVQFWGVLNINHHMFATCSLFMLAYHICILYYRKVIFFDNNLHIIAIQFRAWWRPNCLVRKSQDMFLATGLEFRTSILNYMKWRLYEVILANFHLNKNHLQQKQFWCFVIWILESYLGRELFNTPYI